MLEDLIKVAAVAALFTAAPMAAEAAPVLYNIEFDGTVSGDPGTGSFLYDSETDIMTGFVWDFGGGRTGGYGDTLLASSASGVTIGQLLFDYATTGSSVGTDALIVNYGSLLPTETFCKSIASSVFCDVPVIAGLASYKFEDADGTFQGYFTAARAAAVPEPATLALLGAGLAGLGLLRRRTQVSR